MNGRIKELDFLKSIFIILMIIFHLVYIGDSYPYAKQVVYTFHMSAFLIISGYLNNINKEAKAFGRSLLWIFIPYVFMEAGYVVMSAVLPVREKVTELSAGLLLHKAIIAPMGPYWYLHTLILCNASYFLIYKVTDKWKGIIRFIILGIFLYILSEVRLLTFANAIYFLAGVAIRQSGLPIIRVFQPSFLSVVPLVILCCFPENLNRGTLAGVAITYLVISLLLATYTYLPEKVKTLLRYIGSNTLVILLFSPVFTILSKAYLPLFAFDATGICFTIVSVIFVISGCFGVTYVLDRLHISPYFLGKKRMLPPYPPAD
ncbi:acyltransferase family protein [Phocaeicola sp.]|uniref:acyltransferase family protein n=1 Tax=Phocaeicola sp. TaxID=2773926 RepID=UPI003AB7C177